MRAEKPKENVLSFAKKLKEKGFRNKVFLSFLCLSFYAIGGCSWPYVKAIGGIFQEVMEEVNNRLEPKPLPEPDPEPVVRDNANVSEDCPNFSPVQLYIKK